MNRGLKLLSVVICILICQGAIAATDEEPIRPYCPIYYDVEMINVFQTVIHVRCLLKEYDELYGYYIDGSYRCEGVENFLNELRGDVLDNAIHVYDQIGVINYESDNRRLLEQFNVLRKDFNFQYPKSLLELVEIGIIDHLPPSPANEGRYLDSMQESYNQGDVLYIPYKQIEPVFLDSAGGRESYIIVIFGDPSYDRDYLYYPYENGGNFLGELSWVFDTLPQNIDYLSGNLQSMCEIDPAAAALKNSE